MVEESFLGNLIRPRGEHKDTDISVALKTCPKLDVPRKKTHGLKAQSTASELPSC